MARFVDALPIRATTLEITTDATTMTIRTVGADSVEARLTCEPLAVEDYPTPFAAVSPLQAATAGDGFAAAATRLATAAAPIDSALPVLSAAQLTVNGQVLEACTTDRYRAVLITLPIDARADMAAPPPTVVPIQYLKDAARTFKGVDRVRFSVTPPGERRDPDGGPDRFTMTDGHRSLTTRLLPLEFPNVRAHLSGEFPVRAVVPVKPFLEATRMALAVSKKNMPIRLDFQSDQLAVTAGSRGAEQLHVAIPASLLHTDTYRIAFNHVYLQGALKTFQRSVQIDMKPTRSSPVAVLSEGPDADVRASAHQDAEHPGGSVAYRHLLMAVRLT